MYGNDAIKLGMGIAQTIPKRLNTIEGTAIQ
jgi:hypothetical protein